MIELKAIKWQGSNQPRLFIVVIYLKPLELHDELPLYISYNSQSNMRLLEAWLQPELTKPAELSKTQWLTELRFSAMTRVKTQPNHQDLMGLTWPNQVVLLELTKLILWSNSLSTVGAMTGLRIQSRERKTGSLPSWSWQSVSSVEWQAFFVIASYFPPYWYKSRAVAGII